jgi:2-dehydro-3-deoxygluconokinase
MSRVVTLGEIMLRLATPGHARFQQAMPGSLQTTFAGAEASMAASLAYLGMEVAFVSALPMNAVADACVAELRRLGVETRHLRRTEQGRLGIYFLEHGVNQRGGQVLYDREGSAMAITPASAYDWEAIFSDCEWFLLSGITPALSRTAAEVALVAAAEASRRGIVVLCDMNFRRKLWRWEPSMTPLDLARQTMTALMTHVNVWVGGLSDAVSLFGMDPEADTRQAAAGLVARFPTLSRVAMTLREGSSATLQCFSGVLYEAATQTLHAAPVYQMGHIVDRLGAGDAFTAGLVYAWLQNFEAEKAIGFATAAGCLAHSVEGDFNYSSREEIEALMHGEATGRVSR